MTRAIRVLASAMLLAIGSGAGATTITFGGFAGGVPTYSALGVTITAGGQNITATNVPNGTTGIIPESVPYSPFTATFDILTNSVSVDLGDFGGDSDELFLQAFGLGGASLGETSLLIPGTDNVMHTLSLNLSGISYVVFGSRGPSLNGSSVYADNLTFDAPVPEPGTWVLMLAGFAGIGWRLRRRDRRAVLLG